MQDIPRNELLDKLAAGWKARRKSWAKECTIGQFGGSTAACWIDLLKQDWEGEPPEPICVYCELTIQKAFGYLRDGHYNVRFVRRKSWLPIWKCTYDANHPADLQKHELSFEDIMATDWEVWG